MWWIIINLCSEVSLIKDKLEDMDVSLTFAITQSCHDFQNTSVTQQVSRRVRRDSRLGLDFSYFTVQISRLGLVLVSKSHFTEFSVSSRSRKIILQNSRSRLGLEKRDFEISRLVSILGVFSLFSRNFCLLSEGHKQLFSPQVSWS